MNKLEVNSLIDVMVADLKSMVSVDKIRIVGVQTGGFLVAQKLAEALHLVSEIGSLNISFYRDDFTKIGLHPEVRPSKLPFSVDDETIVLVDDVLHTGRTIRAALNEIFDYGRPKKVLLAILVNRGNNELPISPDICGVTLKIDKNQEVKLSKVGDKLNLMVL